MKRIRLREARRRAKLTQAALAEQIGKPQSYISKLETGVIPDPGLRAVVALGKALSIDPLSIRFGDGDQSEPAA